MTKTEKMSKYLDEVLLGPENSARWVILICGVLDQRFFGSNSHSSTVYTPGFCVPPIVMNGDVATVEEYII
jgi:hypothetical protein